MFARYTRALAAGAVLLLALAGCGSSSATGDASQDGKPSYGTVGVQLSWLKNMQFAGMYVADKDGFYRDAGFDKVNLISGGSSATSAEAAVASGKALVGVSSPLITAPAIVNEGAGFKTIGALYQVNPFAIVSAASKPIRSVSDLKGKKIGVSDSNTLVWKAFLKANKLSEKDVTTVPFSDTSMLTTGQVDGYIGYTTTGAAALTASGFKATELLMADAGLPMVGETLIASQDAIDSHRAELKAFLKATIQGWRKALSDKDQAVDLTINDYGKDQQYSKQSMDITYDREKAIIETSETKANGLLTISKDLQSGTVKTLTYAGISVTPSKLFDTSLIDEVISENPELLK
ncbi:ABC transporter substrate-binding protein [Bifidobacterium mongoliense]|uniref:ABC transporter substrate-binding protein n=1 Tax=Bifidobacterium mongoliense TaxID=518643 RepID=UPI002647C766|nr:ABC transporter substrate-binding protein [Bifidobacterium mongoliense]MDN6783091.1 ABC transporter substrate-binding protein [Bifidobacterium mongoliense]MDN6803208.1 ABC transporter substrate-binding protein [Bifidobacterium mongoliense]